MPGAIGANPEVNVRVEIESGKPLLPIKVGPVLRVSVPEMADCPGDMADAFGHGFMKRDGPFQVMPLARGTKPKPFHQNGGPAIHGICHQTIAASYDRRIIKSMIFDERSVRCPCQPRIEADFFCGQFLY